MNFISIKETCIYARDLNSIREFYHTKLGLLIINYEPGKHIFFRCGKSVLLCFNPDDSRQKQSPPAHYCTGKQHFAFEVPSVLYAEAKKKILENDISIIDTIVWKDGAESFYFEDPAGNVLEILPEGAIWG